jgi:hypothetical protein
MYVPEVFWNYIIFTRRGEGKMQGLPFARESLFLACYDAMFQRINQFLYHGNVPYSNSYRPGECHPNSHRQTLYLPTLFFYKRKSRVTRRDKQVFFGGRIYRCDRIQNPPLSGFQRRPKSGAFPITQFEKRLMNAFFSSSRY